MGKSILNQYLALTKFGITLFAILSSLSGYMVGFPMGSSIVISDVALLIVGLYFLCSGSFSLNQAQEKKIDQQMPRTSKRPIVVGWITTYQAVVLGVFMVIFGSFLLYLLNPSTAYWGLFTVFLYNIAYTVFWKKNWAFAAVPGAIPGAMPVVIGYSAVGNVFDIQCFYLFLIMFLWQMPHFWSLAIRFKDDYVKGGIPVLPAVVGDTRTRYHMGLYVFAYVGVTLTLPLVMKANLLYLILVIPMAIKVVYEFFKFFKAKEQKAWLPFFLWVNLSVIVFLLAPAVDQWVYYWSQVAV